MSQGSFGSSDTDPASSNKPKLKRTARAGTQKTWTEPEVVEVLSFLKGTIQDGKNIEASFNLVNKITLN